MYLSFESEGLANYPTIVTPPPTPPPPILSMPVGLADLSLPPAGPSRHQSLYALPGGTALALIGGGTVPFFVSWNPGHWGASNSTATAGFLNDGVTHQDATSRFFPEMDDILKDLTCPGYRLAYKWHGIDAGIGVLSANAAGLTSMTLSSFFLGQGHPTSGTYWVSFNTSTTSPNALAYRQCTLSGSTLTWSNPLPGGTFTAVHFYNTTLIDQVLNRLGSQYSTPRHLVLTLEVMSFANGSRGHDLQIIPNYILNDPTTYGTSPDGAGGWWGASPGDFTSNHLYSAATWRPSVRGMYSACGIALGVKYNTNELFEGIMDQETSPSVQAAFAGTQWPGTTPVTYPPGNNDPTYGSDSNFVNQIMAWLTAWRSTFPNKSILEQNTFLATSSPTQFLEQWMITGGQYIAPSSADVIGLIHIQSGPTPVSSWGLQAYRGYTADQSNYSGPDYSPIARCMVDLESPDYGKFGATNQDLANSCNVAYKASHVFWTRTSPAQWAALLPTLQSTPLINIVYPQNYPR